MVNIRSLLFVFAGLVVSTLVGHTAAAVSIPDPDAVDAVLDRYVDEGYYPFIYARLEDRDGNVLYEHSAVNRELLQDAEINGQTWIRIWSMSKIITISTVLDLVEDGILSLGDPVKKYIPEFADMQVAVTADGRNLSEVEREHGASACPFELAPVDRVMTVRHLINHEAGFYYALTNIPCLDSALNEQNVAVAANSQDFIDRLARLPLIQQPGEKYHYGTNTTVLGMVAERATNKSLKQLVEERLTGPLSINGLQYGLPADTELLPRISGQDGELRVAHAGEPMRARGTGEAGLWIGGGYEGTHFWVDPKREFVGVIMSQMWGGPEGGGGRDEAIRAELYRQFWAEEAN